MSLSLNSASAGYGDHQVLHGVDLSVGAGELVGVIGPNGAGKSTVLRSLSRQLALVGGSVTLDGRPLHDYGRSELARLIAVVSQSPALPAGFTVEEVVAMGRTPHLGLLGTLDAHSRDAVAGAIRLTGLASLAGRKVDALSGGERQRTVLARALAQEPRYLLLDEPTNHLDLRYQVEVLRLARAHVAAGGGALAVLHDLNLAARACDHLVLLDRGRVAASGAPASVLSAELLTEVYATRISVVLHDGVHHIAAAL